MDLGVEWQMGTNTLYALDSESYSNGRPLTGMIGNMVRNRRNPGIAGAFPAMSETSSTDALFRFGILNDHVRLDAAIRAKEEDIEPNCWPIPASWFGQYSGRNKDRRGNPLPGTD